MEFSPAHCRAARALLAWSQADLGAASGVGRKTIADLEREARLPYDPAHDAIRTAFERAGVEFIDGDAPEVRLKYSRMSARVGAHRNQPVRTGFVVVLFQMAGRVRRQLRPVALRSHAPS